MKMKKIFFTLIVTILLISCKKETSSPNNTTSNTNVIHTDTTKTSSEVSISGFDCAGVVISGKLTKNKVVSNVTATISYSGGNGRSYSTKTHSSTGVTGLIATLQEGFLSYGIGTLVYSISGTPTSAGTAFFLIDFGGENCTLNLKVEDALPTSGYGPQISDIEGNTYKTVFIGEQHWMAENLKVSKYNDGTEIPNLTDENQWVGTGKGAWVYYDNDSKYNIKYGKLYNWYTVYNNSSKNVCPSGWHVPTFSELIVLINYLKKDGDDFLGKKMKETGTTSWSESVDSKHVTNSSLFTGLPGGERNSFDEGGSDGIYTEFRSIGKWGFWWCSNEYSKDEAWYYGLGFDYSSLFNNSGDKYEGYSVRCVKD